MGAKDTDYKEKAVAWLVTTGMKAKRKIGAECGFSKIGGVFKKKTLKKWIKSCSGTPNMSSLMKSTVRVARKHVKSSGGRSKKKIRINHLASSESQKRGAL